nr:hypothetical protein [Tanacetum cinerariifolium]
VLALEKTKTTQALEITSLKRRVKKLEKKKRSRTHKLKRLYKGRIEAIDVDEDINTAKLIIDNAQVNAAGEANAASIATTDSAAATITINEVTLAKALVELKASKPKVKKVVIQDPSETITTTKTISLKSQDKGKGIMVEEPMKPKKKDQIKLDEEAALKLQGE